MILKHRDKELLRFEWVNDTRVRIVSLNEEARRLLPLEFGETRLTCDAEDLRCPLEDWLVSRSAPVGRHFMCNLMDSLGINFKKHRHYNWDEPRRKVLTGFLQKRISEICRFGREADEKSEQSLALAAIFPKENVRVKSSSSGLNVFEEKVAKLILRNSSITETEIANQLAITFRQVARIIAALKQKAGLKRRGTDKVGEWYFQ